MPVPSANPTKGGQAALRSYDAWQTSMRNFNYWIGDSVPGGSDLDFICEHNGRFIVLESKPYFGGVKVPWGQHKMLLGLARTPNFEVYLVGEGKQDRLHIVRYEVGAADSVYRRPNAVFSPHPFMSTDHEGLRDLLRKWWEA